MKKIIATIFIGLVLIACKKDESVQQVETQSTQEKTNIGNIGAEFPQGKAIFTDENGQIIISFDTQANKGVMRFRDREIDLNNLSFTEDRYEIEGKGIHIVAENGEFQDQKENCIEGVFPTLSITIDGREYILNNVKVKDCRIY